MRLISWNVNGRYGAALAAQIEAVLDRHPNVVALQEVRKESLGTWRDRLAAGGLVQQLDSSTLLAIPGPSGRDYKRRYFNLIAATYPLEQLDGLEIAYPERYLAATACAGGIDFEL